MNEEYLIHYGVKGMRWGVRRSVKQRSTNVARLTSLQKQNSKVIKRTDNTISKQMSNLPYSSRPSKLKQSIAKNQKKSAFLKNENAIIDRYKRHLSKNISPEDIKRGERRLKMLNVGKHLVAPMITSGILEKRRQDQLNEAYAFSNRNRDSSYRNYRRSTR